MFSNDTEIKEAALVDKGVAPVSGSAATETRLSNGPLVNIDVQIGVGDGSGRSEIALLNPLSGLREVRVSPKSLLNLQLDDSCNGLAQLSFTDPHYGVSENLHERIQTVIGTALNKVQDRIPAADAERLHGIFTVKISDLPSSVNDFAINNDIQKAFFEELERQLTNSLEGILDPARRTSSQYNGAKVAQRPLVTAAESPLASADLPGFSSLASAPSKKVDGAA